MGFFVFGDWGFSGWVCRDGLIDGWIDGLDWVVGMGEWDLG